MNVADPDTIISVSTTMFSVTKKIVSVSSKVMCVAEKTVSLADLIFDAAQTPGFDSWKIADKREWIVFVKGKTGRKEAGRTGVSDVKQSACLAWIVVFPFMPPYRASRVPFLTR